MGRYTKMGEVIEGPFKDTPVTKVFDAAREEKLDTIIIVGWKNGELWMHASTNDAPDALWMLEQAKKALLAMSG